MDEWSCLFVRQAKEYVLGIFVRNFTVRSVQHLASRNVARTVKMSKRHSDFAAVHLRFNSVKSTIIMF